MAIYSRRFEVLGYHFLHLDLFFRELQFCLPADRIGEKWLWRPAYEIIRGCPKGDNTPFTKVVFEVALRYVQESHKSFLTLLHKRNLPKKAKDILANSESLYWFLSRRLPLISIRLRCLHPNAPSELRDAQSVSYYVVHIGPSGGKLVSDSTDPWEILLTPEIKSGLPLFYKLRDPNETKSMLETGLNPPRSLSSILFELPECLPGDEDPRPGEQILDLRGARLSFIDKSPVIATYMNKLRSDDTNKDVGSNVIGEEGKKAAAREKRQRRGERSGGERKYAAIKTRTK